MDELTFFKNQVNDMNEEILALKSEIAYMKGKVDVYEKFLKDKGFIKDEENEHTQIQKACD